MDCPTSPTWGDKWDSIVPLDLRDISGIGWTHRFDCIGGGSEDSIGLSHLSYMRQVG